METNNNNLEIKQNEIMPHNEILEALITQIQPINFDNRAQLPDGEKLKKKHYIIICSEEIQNLAHSKNWALCKSNGQIYIFNGAYWKVLSKEELESFLGKGAGRLGVDQFDAKYYSYRGDLLKQFISMAFLPKPVRKYGEVKINLQNGTFVITPERQYIKSYDKDDFLTYQLPFNYTPDADAPIFQKYLETVLPDPDQQKVLAESIGSVFISQKSLKLEKTLILYGTGANGKSVFFEIVNALLGQENITNYSLQSLTDNSGYSRAMLSHKLLNYASEISPRMDSTFFKALVSGEPVEARLPYGQPFILEDYAKLIFNTNELPREVEQSVAFFRRFLILHFAVTIPESDRDPELAKKIIQTELPGVFNWVLGGLKRLLAQSDFTQSALVDEALKTYQTQSDSVLLFLQEEGYVKDVKEETRLKSLFVQYNKFCGDSNYRAVSSKTFHERLRNAGFTFTRKAQGNYVDAFKKGF